MNFLDMRTILVAYLLNSLTSVLVLLSMWLQNRKRTQGIFLWVLDYILQFLAVLLVSLRGFIPDFFSITLSFTFLMLGAVLVYWGLEQFIGKKTSLWLNLILLAGLVSVNAWFTYAQPSLLARNLNLSAGLIIFCTRSAWLMLRGADPALRPAVHRVAYVFIVYTVVSVIRIAIDLSIPPAADVMESGLVDSLVILIYQVLSMGLTFTLFLTVHRRLLLELRNDNQQRRLAEDAMRASEEKFSVAFQNIPDAIVINSLKDGRIIEINDGFFRISDYTRTDVLGSTSEELDIWSSPEERLRFLEEFQKNPHLTNFETVFRRKQGQPFHALLACQAIELAGEPCLLTVIRDVSIAREQEEQMQAAQQELRRLLAEADRSRRALLSLVEDYKLTGDLLRQRNVFIETILANSPIGFAVYRASDGVATYVSDKFESIYGLKPGSLTSVEGFFEKAFEDPLRRERLRSDVRADVASGDPARMEWEDIPINTADGRQTVISASNIPIPDQDLMIATVQDVTERWQAEEQVRRLNTELEQRVADRTARLEAANQELEAFSYSVSHDLRAPLRALEGFSTALLSQYSSQLDDQGRHYLERIKQAAVRMGQLINDLLNLSRLTRSELTLHKVDLHAICMEIANELKNREPQRQVEFIIAEPMHAQADSRLLRIALLNLMENAWKFTSACTLTRIEIGVLSPAFIKPPAGLEGIKGKIVFIRDNGVGFDMQYAGKLFTPFQRLHGADEFPGTGIGLAIVQRIISRHGGRIWTQSTPEEGATFFFTLGERS